MVPQRLGPRIGDIHQLRSGRGGQLLIREDRRPGNAVIPVDRIEGVVEIRLKRLQQLDELPGGHRSWRQVCPRPRPNRGGRHIVIHVPSGIAGVKVQLRQERIPIPDQLVQDIKQVFPPQPVIFNALCHTTSEGLSEGRSRPTPPSASRSTSVRPCWPCRTPRTSSPPHSPPR